MIYTSSLAGAQKAIDRLCPSHVVSFVDPDTVLPLVNRNTTAHLVIERHDIIRPRADRLCPDRDAINALIAFADTWNAHRHRPVLIHCFAGISRSTAAAFVLACAAWPTASEMMIAEAMHAAARHAWPNSLIVEIADEVLGREGRMTDALETFYQGMRASTRGANADPCLIFPGEP